MQMRSSLVEMKHHVEHPEVRIAFLKALRKGCQSRGGTISVLCPAGAVSEISDLKYGLMKELLLLAKEKKEEIISKANEQAQEIIDAAKAKASEMTNGLDTRLEQLKAETETMKKEFDTFKAKFEDMLTAQLDYLKHNADADSIASSFEEKSAVVNG